MYSNFVNLLIWQAGAVDSLWYLANGSRFAQRSRSMKSLQYRSPKSESRDFAMASLESSLVEFLRTAAICL